MSEDIKDENNDHIGLIFRVAQELMSTEDVCVRAFGGDIFECLGEGFLAVQIAKKKFKPKLGWQFSTYATAVIRDRLLQAARRSTLIRISCQARYQATRMIQGKDVKPGYEQKIKDALRILCQGIKPISSATGCGKSDEDPFWEIKEELNVRLKELDERTQNVLVMRYGLNGDSPLTLEEVGEKLNPPITRERVRQIEKNGLDKLREVINI